MSRHAEFVADLAAGRDRWNMSSLGAALRVAYGPRALLKHRLAVSGVLLPLLAYAVYAAWGRRVDLLAWVVLGWLAARAASPRPTGIGMICCLGLALVGGLVALVRGDALHLLGGVLPGVTWFLSCAVQGMATLQLRDDLLGSAELFDALHAAHILQAASASSAVAQHVH